jgi:hypothetical protein
VYTCNDCGHRAVGPTLDAAVLARDHQYDHHGREEGWRYHVVCTAELVVTTQPRLEFG